MDENKTWITEEQVLALGRALGTARKEKGFHVDELLKVVKWAEDILFRVALLEAVLSGTVLVDIDKNGEIVFLAGKEPK